jgi:hypothetical protein
LSKNPILSLEEIEELARKIAIIRDKGRQFTIKYKKEENADKEEEFLKIVDPAVFSLLYDAILTHFIYEYEGTAQITETVIIPYTFVKDVFIVPPLNSSGLYQKITNDKTLNDDNVRLLLKIVDRSLNSDKVDFCPYPDIANNGDLVIYLHFNVEYE